MLFKEGGVWNELWIICVWNFCIIINIVYKLIKYWLLLIWNMIDFINYKIIR